MIKNICLIDADSLAYLGKTDDTLQQIIEKVDYKIQAILEETKVDYYCLFVSKGQYFRHALKDKSEESGSYKANRKYSNQNYNKVIKEYLVAQYGAISSSLVEADDSISYWMNNHNKIGYSEELNKIDFKWKLRDNYQVSFEDCIFTMAAVDKDLLKSIPGKHLVYNKKLGIDEWNMEWIETTEEESTKFKLKQLIVGDTSDGVPGIPKKGEKYWEKMLEQGKYQLDTILFEYCHYYGVSQGIYEFQKSYRLLHLLETDEDWMREVGYIPELPTFLEVDKPKSIESEF